MPEEKALLFSSDKYKGKLIAGLISKWLFITLPQRQLGYFTLCRQGYVVIVVVTKPGSPFYLLPIPCLILL